jgi:2-polyprenyl-6-methoxyphenol hydroxylase-like FAD-dependent oxidoreductase/catechol 2,3-dioxygenase-like lactoylglutathione lyase family enzyme
VKESFDVIIVGARCAGAPLATMLARAGLRVCVVDKDRFPSDTLSTHGIQPTGVQVLERLGVLDSLLKVAPPLLRLRMVFDDVAVPVADVVAITGAPGLNVRRITFDEILVNAAADAGAEVRTQTAITGLVMDGDRVAGVTTPAGELHAPLVVGADGSRSAVAKMVGAREYHPTKNGRVFMWAYYEADPTNGEMWIGKLGDHTYLSTPTDNGLALVATCPSIGRRGEVHADREAVYEAGVRAWPELHAGVVGARREGPVHTMANMPGFFRPSAGPGWVLIGDAGHFKDPTPGQGIADALRQAEKLAAAITRALGGAGRPDEILRDWWRWRDEDAWEMYWLAHDMGAAGPTPPLRREAERRIAADPELTVAMVRVLNHDLRPSKAFTPSFALTMLTQALRHGRGHRRAIMRDARTTVVDELRHRRTSAHLDLRREASEGLLEPDGRSEMTSGDVSGESASGSPPVKAGEMRLEVVVVPVSDVDRAKRFYESLGWRLDADLPVDDGYRVVQLTPPGSGCSIIFGEGVTSVPPGSADGLQLSVYDIDETRADLVRRGIDVSDLFHDATGIFHHAGTEGRVSGPAPDHADYGSFVAFSDPDGNGWLLQEIKQRLPGR